MREIKKIIVHCTASKEGQNVTVENIDKLHKSKGWQGCGYHYVIYLDGSVHKGRDERVIGAHCYGYNVESIGVCYVGGLDRNGKPKDTRTIQQKTALRNLLIELLQKYPNATIHGHCEFANKACPCFDVQKEYADLNVKIKP